MGYIKNIRRDLGTMTPARRLARRKMISTISQGPAADYTARDWARIGQVRREELPERERLIWKYDNELRDARAREEARKIAPSLRRRVMERDGGLCVYCGGTAHVIDHVHPVDLGGRRNFGNLAAACESCNREKRARTVENWRAHRLALGLSWPPPAGLPPVPATTTS